MVIETVLGTVVGSFFSGIVSYYIGYHCGIKKNKKFVFFSNNKNYSNRKIIDSSKSM